MKTFKKSVTMKAIFSLLIAMTFTVFVNGQFETPSPDAPVTQTPTEDVRTGGSIEYNISAGHAAGEQYRWEVVGGTITAGGTVTTGGGGESIIEWTADAHTITIDWDQAPAAVASVSASISVQKLSSDGCYSQIQTLPINVWNLPTANIADADVEICSGDATAGTITVNLTGAPDNSGGNGFSVNYEYVAPDIEDGTGSVDGQTGTVTSNDATVTIPLPANLISTVVDGDRTFTVNLTAMTDDFDDQDGTWTDGTYVITVHPSLETGDILSGTPSLSRR